MKKLTQLFFTVIICISFSNVTAQTQEEMKAWMEYMTPGPVHEMLAKSDGAWTGDNTFWMAPGAPPMNTKSEAVFSMIMGGRYQQGKHTGDMMGMPFEGMSLLGYDNAMNEFHSVWFDNMGTGIMFLKGKWDEATNSATLTGQMTDPESKQLIDIREVFTMTDNDNHKMEMYFTKDGSEFKAMEILYKRK
ncbi:MAG TPA: DUF1579 domain-containing protein [Ignavibacteria bacterium]|nr:hypothetical protein [Bacteroidota bacterium]HRI85028.1 DUF1579 domain-containing protein [Ignavibacteria bacterium]HRJ98648.1 DUF1579 domain-containing protein [Ignavibacteria bacterium]